jgi:hypothetical protein
VLHASGVPRRGFTKASCRATPRGSERPAQTRSAMLRVLPGAGAMSRSGSHGSVADSQTGRRVSRAGSRSKRTGSAQLGHQARTATPLSSIVHLRTTGAYAGKPSNRQKNPGCGRNPEATDAIALSTHGGGLRLVGQGRRRLQLEAGRCVSAPSQGQLGRAGRGVREASARQLRTVRRSSGSAWPGPWPAMSWVCGVACNGTSGRG